MMKSRNMSPSQSTPEPAGSTSVAAVTSTVSSTDSAGKVLKKRKSVSWAEGSQLEQIKLIERAIYDDDPADVSDFSIFVTVFRYSHSFLSLFQFRECTRHIVFAI